MGSNLINTYLPKVIETIQQWRLNVGWIIDPMHGNTFSMNGYKTRNVRDIKQELEFFFNIIRRYDVIPAGIHMEMTHKNVTEVCSSESDNLRINYDTKCDPRLNNRQSFDIAFHVVNHLQV